MTDREKVIKGLECAIGIRGVKDCDNCPYDYDFNCLGCDIVMWDALALLREQEPVEPHVEHDSDDDCWYYGCGACHEAIDYKDKFCRHCGRKVKWDETD